MSTNAHTDKVELAIGDSFMIVTETAVLTASVTGIRLRQASAASKEVTNATDGAPCASCASCTPTTVSIQADIQDRVERNGIR